MSVRDNSLRRIDRIIQLHYSVRCDVHTSLGSLEKTSATCELSCPSMTIQGFKNMKPAVCDEGAGKRRRCSEASLLLLLRVNATPAPPGQHTEIPRP